MDREFRKAVRSKLKWGPHYCDLEGRKGLYPTAKPSEAKARVHRAMRRIDSCLIEEGLEDYYGELQEELDAFYDESMRLGFVEETVDEGPELDLDQLCLVFNGNHEYFMDCNHPGVVYYCTSAHLKRSMDTLGDEGGQPCELSRESALSLVTEGDDFDGRWDLRACPLWWYGAEERG